jgi:hypothetical protein
MMFGAAYVLLELISLILYGITQGQVFSFEAIHTKQTQVIDRQLGASTNPEVDPGVTRVLHPYLGYTLRNSIGMNDYGFPGKLDPLSIDPSDFVIAITGGSVARFLYRDGHEDLLDLLELSPELSKRRIRIVSLAFVGYKQPQQLF